MAVTLEHLVVADALPAAVITLNRPDKLNALSLPLMEELIAELERQGGRDEVAVIVIRGAGRAFSAGHDLKELVARTLDEERSVFQACERLMALVQSVPQPVIASVHGIATAAGCQLVAACDLAVASSAATFGTSGINNGLFCGSPSVPVGRNVGPKRALDMLFTGQSIDAATALRDGLVSRVAPPDQLDQETMALANQIAAQPPGQIADGKAMFHKHMEMDLTQAYAYATEFMAGAIQSEDARAGIDAFVNKKPKPKWTGR
jgi:enoyl-CoA hydratase/carnithine racemase